MSYNIRYSTKRGGSGMATVSTNAEAKKELLRIFKQRQTARVEKAGLVIGECYKKDGRWEWYLDTEA